ncbi:flavodoxin family protein [Vibrio metoecus]|uniref:flavodoxin family protein n=1 Tax=Vibrio metoecus TaxID=1481663 RepID=UPI0012AE1AB6|nr:flavodoxin [Vibrio metoecus]
MTRWIIIIAVLAIVAAFTVAFVVTRVENSQSSKNKQLRQFGPLSVTTESNVAVIVFSRSGSTGVLAKHIAEKKNGRLYEITAKDYDLGIPGWISALKDARSNIADISPETIDLSTYETVYLGSPIWLYSPAPPIWQFAKNSDFTGKDVVLFNTFNSKFEESFIKDFESLVRSKGAVSFKHQYVDRGRMGNQISIEEMLNHFDKLE